MDEQTKKRLEQMTREEQEARFSELRIRLGIAEPTSIAGWRKPAASIEEREEYQFLRRRLGHH